MEFAPLAPRSGSDGSGALFTRLDPSGTGMDFVNPIDESHALAHLHATEKTCGGAAVGDVDGDGRPDIFLTSGPRRDRLFRQAEPFKFEDVTDAAGVAGGETWSAGAAMCDIDGDGDTDIFVAKYAAPNLVFINRGDGTFDERAEEFGLDAVTASHMPAFCDYDLDGDLDLYLLTNRFHSPEGSPPPDEAITFAAQDGKLHVGLADPKWNLYFRPIQNGTAPDGRPIFGLTKLGQPDILYRNEGGKFRDVTEQAGIADRGFGLSATWWDFNADGWPDLWVGNDFDEPDAVYRSNGDGTFTDIVRPATPHITWFSMGADFGDVSGDGLPDFLIADMSGTNHFKQKTNMGAMGAKAEFLRTADPQQYMRNALFISSGTERFLEGAFLAGLANSDWTWAVKLCDFDCDGRNDVFFTNGMSRNFNDSDAISGPPQPYETEWERHRKAGTPELREQNLAFRATGDLEFDDASKAWGLDHVGMSFAAADADLDGDGDLDLIVTNLGEPASIYRNDVREGNRLVVSLKGRAPNTAGIGASLALRAGGRLQVRQLIPVRGYLSSNEPIVHFGLGDVEMVESLEIAWPGGAMQKIAGIAANQLVTFTEPEGEPTTKPAPPPWRAVMSGEPLLTESDALDSAAHAENEYDDFADQPLLPNKMSQLGPGMAWGDVNGDGADDLWLGGAAGEPGQIWTAFADGSFRRLPSAALDADAASEDMGGLWLDADADGDMDLYVASGGYEFDPGAAELQDRLYFNDGSGSLARAPDGAIPSDRSSDGPVAAADFDRDGDLDLFVGCRQIPKDYPASGPSRLLRNDGGTFSDVTSEFAPALADAGLVTSALWSDVDRDGWIDLVVAAEWGPVRLLRSEDGTLVDQTVTAGLAEFTGWWNGIAAADFDGDGDTDFAVTNFGLNTKYHASLDAPALIYYGDFEKTGERHIVEAEFEGSSLYPVRGRSCSSEAMPHLREKFSSFKQFAAAELGEIYSPWSLQDSLQLSISTLESGVIVNESSAGADGSLKFSFRPLPKLAQIAPAFGIAAADISGDSIPDLVVAQNFYSPQVETGRMAGGLSVVLIGKGDSSFTALPAWKSGLAIPGDAAGAAITDVNTDGAPDIVVTENNAPVHVFTLRAGNERAAPFITVALRDGKSPGNPHGIGALVTLASEGAPLQTAEITAGHSYLTQSPAAATFTAPSSATDLTLAVRWPDGESTSKTVPPQSAGSGVITIAR